MKSNIINLKNKLVYIGSILSIFGHSIEIIFVETFKNVVLLNMATVLIALLVIVLFRYAKMRSNLANGILIYSIYLNTLISILIKINVVNINEIFFSSAMLYGILAFYVGFSLKRIHIFILGISYIIFYLFCAFYSHSEVLLSSMPMLLILLGCYIFGVNFVVKVLNTYHKNQIELINNLKESNDRLRIQREELNRLNKTKDKLFSIIGHDLLTPANSIMGFAELISIRADESGSKTIKDYSKLIYQSSNKLNILINQLLDWARLQIGSTKVNLQLININSIIKDVVDLMHGTTYLKNINVINPEASEVVFYADKQMLSTVIRNLVTNALKYTPKNGNISISSKFEKDEYIFSIKDSGIGIDKTTLDNIFSDNTVDSTPGTENEKGTGLGLIICRQYINLHKGKIWVESEPGLGATFYFSIPLSQNSGGIGIN